MLLFHVNVLTIYAIHLEHIHLGTYSKVWDIWVCVQIIYLYRTWAGENLPLGNITIWPRNKNKLHHFRPIAYQNTLAHAPTHMIIDV